MHRLELLGGTAGLGSWLTGWGLATLGRCILLRRRKLVKVEPNALMVIDILFKFLNLSLTQCYFSSSILSTCR
jgi:hypothetical protein